MRRQVSCRGDVCSRGENSNYKREKGIIAAAWMSFTPGSRQYFDFFIRRFLAEEPGKLENTMRRCKKLTSTLVTLRRYAPFCAAYHGRNDAKSIFLCRRNIGWRRCRSSGKPIRPRRRRRRIISPRSPKGKRRRQIHFLHIVPLDIDIELRSQSTPTSSTESSTCTVQQKTSLQVTIGRPF